MNGVALFQRGQGLFVGIVVLIVMTTESRPPGIKNAPPRGLPAGIGKGDSDFLRLVAHGRMELQTKGRGDHEVEIVFLLRERVRKDFACGRDGVVRRHLFGVPCGAFQGGVRLARHPLQTGKRGERGQHGGGIRKLFFRQIAAIGARIGGQLFLVQGLRGIQHFLSRHAEL